MPRRPTPLTRTWASALICATASAAAGLSTPAPAAAAREPLGPSVTLGPVLKHANCHVRGGLPDAGCTPGARFSKVTTTRVCRVGYTAAARNVSTRTRKAVYASYDINPPFNGRNGELDHLVSLELGGSNSRTNLFPEAARPRPGSHEKDRLENRLHDDMCNGQITMRHAQQLIAGNWVNAYRSRFS